MKLLTNKATKLMLGLGAVFFMTSCHREGCPANQFSIDVVELLQRTLESILF